MHVKQVEYVVFDVETTGLSPQSGDRIVEIAAARVKNSEITDEFTSFINPLRDIPLEAQNVHKITSEMVSDAPTAEEVLPQIIDFVGGACLVGHNIKFDLDFLCFELSLYSRRLKDVTPAIDTLKIARKLLPHLSSYKLSSLAMTSGIKIGETHRALADVRLTAMVLNRLLQVSCERGIANFDDVLKEFGVQKPNFKIEQVNQEFLF